MRRSYGVWAISFRTEAIVEKRGRESFYNLWLSLPSWIFVSERSAVTNSIRWHMDGPNPVMVSRVSGVDSVEKDSRPLFIRLIFIHLLVDSALASQSSQVVRL